MKVLKDNPPAAVYRHMNAEGETLYIGCSINPMARFNYHRSMSSWSMDVVNISIQWFPTQEEALNEERRLIVDEEPPYNRNPLPRRYQRAQSNGPKILKLWMSTFGVSERSVGAALGGNLATVQNLLKENASPRNAKAHKVTVVTGGHVPASVWDRQRQHPIKLASDEEAEENMAKAKEHLSRWGQYCPEPIAASRPPKGAA